MNRICVVLIIMFNSMVYESRRQYKSWKICFQLCLIWVEKQMCPYTCTVEKWWSCLRLTVYYQNGWGLLKVRNYVFEYLKYQKLFHTQLFNNYVRLAAVGSTVFFVIHTFSAYYVTSSDSNQQFILDMGSEGSFGESVYRHCSGQYRWTFWSESVHSFSVLPCTSLLLWRRLCTLYLNSTANFF